MTEVTSLLDVNLDDSVEFTTLPDNSEARLEIVRAEFAESKSDTPAEYNLVLVLASDRDDVDDIWTWTPVPNAAWRDVDKKQYIKAVNRFKEVTTCFGILMPCELDNVVGSTGWCLMGEEEDDRNPGKMRNFIRRYNQPSS